MSTEGFDLFERLTGYDMLSEAWRKVRGNDGCAGGDGMSVDRFQQRVPGALRALSKDLRDASYRPGPYRQLQIRKSDGGTRPLAIPSVVDRVAQTAAALVLTPVLDPLFDPDSYGYRPGKSVAQAVRRIGLLRRRGFTWVAEADIVRCFERIPHDPLLARLEQVLAGRRGAAAIVDLVAHWLEHAGTALGTMGRGLPQGSPLSPLLANLYLDQLDETLEARGITLVRFADDFVMLARSEAAAEDALRHAHAILDDHGLEMHGEGARVVGFDEGFSFLGHLFVRSLVMKQEADPEEDVFGLMRAVALQDDETAQAEVAERSAGYDRGDRVLYMTEAGRRLTLSNLSFSVEAEAGRSMLTLAHARVDRIEIGPDVDFDPEALRHALYTDTDIALVDGRGDTVGWVERPGSDRAALHLAQARLVLDPVRRTDLARRIVEARLRNQRARLQVLNREAQDAEVIVAAKTLGRMIRKLPAAPDVAALRGHEGAAAAVYWPALARCCVGASQPFQRSRPGRDPLNAAINYLTALLGRDVRAAVISAGLHPGFGVLHAPSDRHEACVWDLMEGPRAVYTEGLAVGLFNRGHLKADMFESVPRKGVRIAPEGRRALIKGYEAAMDRRVKSSFSSRRLAGRPRLREEARALGKHARDPEAHGFMPALQDY